MRWLFNCHYDINEEGASNRSREYVLSSEDYMLLIFDKVAPQPKLKYFYNHRMSVVCKRWAQMFMFHQEALRLAKAYTHAINRAYGNGIAVVTRNDKVVSKMCICNKFDYRLGHKLLHLRQLAISPIVTEDLTSIIGHLGFVYG
ncbi:hypothetical protein RND81_11G066200 [Saponaria officinalis]|uniref:Uncharacterized protein n=1 Tax=Saponaria officinalis TaxID=3572 RepID=A0AAW1HHP2_SAPOF